VRSNIQRVAVRAALATVLLLSLGPAAARAQLTQSSGVAIEYGRAGDDAIVPTLAAPFEGLVTPGASPGAGTLRFNLTGDINVAFPVAEPQQVFVNAFVQFQAGPLPVRITPSFEASFKLVNGGGTFTAPITVGNAGFTLYESGGYDADAEGADSGLLGPSIYSGNVDNFSDPIVGNGLKVIDGAADPMPAYILGAGVNYTFILGFNAIVSTADLPRGSPTSVVTIEAGGISGWDGATVTVDYEVVPEPASAGTLATLAALALCRRRR
jgi:hypothetical protein